jgi:hypothetical protein
MDIMITFYIFVYSCRIHTQLYERDRGRQRVRETYYRFPLVKRQEVRAGPAGISHHLWQKKWIGGRRILLLKTKTLSPCHGGL